MKHNDFDSNFDYIGIIRDELLTTLAQAPINEPKDLHVEKMLQQLLGNHDWTKSFSRQQMLIYDDVLPVELLVIIHKWLRKKCANIENIQLITTHHTGVSNWWKDWCKTHHERSFSICEIFFTNRPKPHMQTMGLFYQSPNVLIRDTKFFLKQKTISKLFSYYGGGYATSEREYLLLKFAKFHQLAELDFLGKLSSLDAILAYVENLTYYKNQTEINELVDVYAKIVNKKITLLSHNSIEAQKCESINLSGLQWKTDRHCWASVIRETLVDNRFSCITEKTIRTFLHHCVAIPLGYRAVDDLEQLGFWFPHDIVDYSYQHEDLFSVRVNKLIKSLDQLLLQPLTELQQYYVDNIDKFQHNAELVGKLYAEQPVLHFTAYHTNKKVETVLNEGNLCDVDLRPL